MTRKPGWITGQGPIGARAQGNQIGMTGRLLARAAARIFAG